MKSKVEYRNGANLHKYVKNKYGGALDIPEVIKERKGELVKRLKAKRDVNCVSVKMKPGVVPAGPSGCFKEVGGTPLSSEVPTKPVGSDSPSLVDKV